ncbi:MAG: hypothetical protein KDK06_09045 [Gammaproteobacteria bacterium]|nr:hypothetical protein [Gammaproteobacteria bacterium]
MRKLVIYSSLILSIACGRALADATGPDYWRINADAPVSMRMERDTGSDAVRQRSVDAGGLINLGCAGRLSFAEWSQLPEQGLRRSSDTTWCKVRYLGDEGWIPGRYLVEDGILQPGFDCARADHEAEQIVCAEPELMQLDVLMNKVFAQALATAGSLDIGAERKVRELRASPRGWIGGRDECWKAIEGKLACIRSVYLQRISRLQARWTLADGRAPVTYRCDDQGEFVATIYTTDALEAVVVEYGDSPRIHVSTDSERANRYDGEFGRYVLFGAATARFVPEQREPLRRCEIAQDT